MDLQDLMLLQMSGTGGGGSQTVYYNPIDAPPINPTQWDDEFDSATLSPKWGWLNQRGASVAINNGCAYVSLVATGSPQCTGLVQTAPTSNDYTIIASVPYSLLWQDYTKFGVILSESSAGKQQGLFLAHHNDSYTNTGNRGIQRETFNNPSTRASFEYYGVRTEAMGYIKVRVYQEAGVWYMDANYSRDGNTWDAGMVKYAIGFQPTSIGIGGDNEVAFANTIGFDWFRVVLNA